MMRHSAEALSRFVRRPSHCLCRCREAAEKAALAAAQKAEQDVAVKDEEFAEKQR